MDAPQKPRRLFGLQQHIGVLYTSLMLFTCLTLAVTTYYMVAEMTMSATNHVVDSATRTIRSEAVHGVRNPVQALVKAMAQGAAAKGGTLEERLVALSTTKSMLGSYPFVNSIYVGYDDGDFFIVHFLHSDAVRHFFTAPPDSVLMVESIEHRTNEVDFQYLFFDADMNLLLRRTQPEQNIYPHVHPSFLQATRHSGLTVSAPYLLSASQEIGITVARKSQNGEAVVGADISLSKLSEVLAHELPTPGSRFALIGSNDALFAYDSGMKIKTENNTTVRVRTVDDLDPILLKGLRAYQAGQRGRGINITHEGMDWMLSLEEIMSTEGNSDILLLAVPRDEVLAGAVALLHRNLLVMAGIFLLSLPIIIWGVARGISRPLRKLTEEVQRILLFNFDEQNTTDDTRVSEIHTLTQGIHHMRDSLKKFLEITNVISSERDFSVLLERVLKKNLDVTNADGGLLRLLDAKKNCFREGLAYWKNASGNWVQEITMDCQELDITLPSHQAMLSQTVIQTSIPREDKRNEADFLTPGFSDPEVTHVDLVCVPLRDRMGECLGVLALFKTIKPGIESFQARQVAFIEALASTAAITLENQQLFKAQCELRDAIIQILAGAIDAKSPYTGGHCQRVPVIFEMLLQAACDTDTGQLKNFTLDADQREAAKLAAWLHDCGKVTTPEYVVDKATKLETIYDRIHEIRTRFEVLKRDAEITCLKALLQGADPAIQSQKLETDWHSLDEDFAFVASCNTGSEFMSSAAIERLNTISRLTWVRTLDKRKGVSRDERARMDRNPAAVDLPVREHVLMDKPEHIIERGDNDRISDDNPWGIKMTAPQALYNRGELHNLSIKRGTLTDEDRYKINDHIIQTIIMLDKLPLPKHLQEVPEMAGSHHETMDGKGYPRQLKSDNISWSARMLAISDIFEALTAADRPYKPGKKLSEALEIMDGLKDRKHIDPDVYALFINARIPQQYAKKHLLKNQCDL